MIIARGGSTASVWASVHELRFPNSYVISVCNELNIIGLDVGAHHIGIAYVTCFTVFIMYVDIFV